MYDVVIIGAGAVGCSAARALSRHQGRFAVLEKGDDVCEGTSKANSAICHAGFDAYPRTNKARFNLLGNEMMPQLAKELDFPYVQNGSLVVCTAGQPIENLQVLYERGVANGVRHLEIISGPRLHELEPNLSDEVTAALYAPTAGILCPFQMTIALAENACENGVEFYLNHEVDAVEKKGSHFEIHTDKRVLLSRTVINAAGLSADTIHNMLCDHKLHIIPRKGEYLLLDRTVGNYVKSTIFQLPTAMGKGVLVAPTVHGNLIIGPTALDVDQKDAVNTTQQGLETIGRLCGVGVRQVPVHEVITSFAGIRAHEEGDDFILGEQEDCAGLFDAVGIESPGMVSAPAIGEFLAGEIAQKLQLLVNAHFHPHRKGPVRPAELSAEDYNRLIAKNPAYGRIVCRCEAVSEGEIRDAIRRTLGAGTLDGVKRRTRAGAGRCQAGFCTPGIIKILAEELGTDWTQVTKSGKHSRCLTGVLRPEKKGGVDG